MLGFTPFKKRPNKFNYIPRYYNPEKEAREQRRAELRGERAETGEREYRPGQYIRTQRDAREARRERTAGQSRMRIWVMLAAAVAVLLFIFLVAPRLVSLFMNMGGTPQTEQVAPVQQAAPRDELDQAPITEWQEQPITVVPNDYQPAE